MEYKYGKSLKVIKLPKSIQEGVDKCPLIIGIGPSAWPRIIAAFYFPKFKTLCYGDYQDNEYIRDFGVDVFSLKEKDPYLEVSPVTPGRILDTDLAKEYIKSQKEDFSFLVYKSMGSFERVCRENGWGFIGNPKDIRDPYENKKIFKETLKDIGVETIPGENLKIAEITEDVIRKYQDKFQQKRLVLQIAEATWGGGVGTFFLNDVTDLAPFVETAKELREKQKNKKNKKKRISSVNITPFIGGASTSIAVCTTKYGVLTGPVQNQLVDIKEVGAKLPSRSGNYSGHDWAFQHYPESVQRQADSIARRFGDYIYKKGYRGVFGLDLIVDKKGKVWPVECNPRETDAFPLICMLQMETRAIPMTVFHILENLGVDYSYDFEEVDASYKQKYNASQIWLYNRLEESIIDRNIIKGGVYKISGRKLKFTRPGFLYSDLKNEDEYLFTEQVEKNYGNPHIPHDRITRLIKKGGILDEKGSLKDELKRVIELIYKEFKLIPIKHELQNEYGLEVLYADTLIEAKTSPDIAKSDIVNVVARTRQGITRPYKIAWRKCIDINSRILDQIPSKRAKKQIKVDIEKIKEKGIEIKVIDKINDEIFKSWLNLYEKIISKKEMGTMIVKKDWYDEKKKKGKKVGGVFAYQGNKMIGGELFFEVGKVLCEGYGVSERLKDLSGGLTLLMDYYFLQYAKDNNYQEVSFGQDTNFYGYDLSEGLITYKAKLGFVPKVPCKTYLVDTFFLDFTKLKGEIKFFRQEKESLLLCIVTSDINFDASKVYLPQGVSGIEVNLKDDLVKKSKETFKIT